LVYKLEYPGPHKKHEPQDALNIEDQASYIIQVNDAGKNAWICMFNNPVRYLGMSLVFLFAPWEPGN
jgi:Iap family predicted aminopeptidase